MSGEPYVSRPSSSGWPDVIVDFRIVDEQGNDVAQGTGSAQPAYNASGINGLPAITPDGTDALFRINFTQGLLPQPFEVFAVAKWDGGASSFMVDSPTSQRAIIRNSSGAVALFGGTANQAIVGVSTPSAGEPTIISGRFDGASSAGTLISDEHGEESGGVAASPGTSTIQGVYIGASNVVNNGWTEDIAEVIYFPRVLTTEERNQVLIYLANKYGLPAPLV